MKKTNRFLLILCILFLIDYLNANPINIDSLVQYQSIKIKDPNLIFSLRGGYHTSNVQTSLEGFPSGLEFDAKILISFGHNWHCGFVVDYWWAKDNNFPAINGNSTYERDYNAYGIAIVLEKRNKLGFINLNYGFSLGRYVIGYSFYGGNDSEGYLNLSFEVNADFHIRSNILLGAEISYYSLFNFDKISKILNFKIGPSIMF